jgi:hypothetical protein
MAGEVRWTVLKVEGEVLSDFGVQEEKQTYAKVERGNVDFFFFKLSCISNLHNRAARPCPTSHFLLNGLISPTASVFLFDSTFQAQMLP